MWLCLWFSWINLYFFSFTSFHRAAVVPVELNELMLLWSLCWACVCLDKLTTSLMSTVFTDTSLSVCVPGRKNWKGPGNMRPRRGAPSRCDIPLLTPPFFFICTWDILQQKLKKKTHQCKHCIYYYFYSVPVSTSTCTTIFFFPHPLFPLTWCLSANGNFYGTWINSKGTGCRKGMQNICFLAFFALFFADCFLFMNMKTWRTMKQANPEWVHQVWGPGERRKHMAAVKDLRGQTFEKTKQKKTCFLFFNEINYTQFYLSAVDDIILNLDP